VQAYSLSFGNSVSTTTPLLYLNGTSTAEFIDGTFNGITSLSSSGAVFSDAGSSASRTVVVKLSGITFQGLYASLFYFNLFFFFFLFYFIFFLLL
jgi:hypothetical protein